MGDQTESNDNTRNSSPVSWHENFPSYPKYKHERRVREAKNYSETLMDRVKDDANYYPNDKITSPTKNTMGSDERFLIK